jgi:hypothetical protein
MGWKAKDPLLTSALYKRNRAALKRLRLPCARCHRPIDYTQPGQFVAGHLVARHVARRLGWTPEQINAMSNLQAECRRCSFESGAVEGGRARQALKRTRFVYGQTDAHRW